VTGASGRPSGILTMPHSWARRINLICAGHKSVVLHARQRYEAELRTSAPRFHRALPADQQPHRA
jgi:hypothetical protein